MNPSRDAGKSPAVEVVIPSDPAEARQLQDQIEQLLQEHQAHEKDIFSIKLALEEALVNAIKHGNQMDRTKKVHVTYFVDADRFEVVITRRRPRLRPRATCPTPPPSRTSNAPAAAA